MLDFAALFTVSDGEQRGAVVWRLTPRAADLRSPLASLRWREYTEAYPPPSWLQSGSGPRSSGLAEPRPELRRRIGRPLR